MGSLVGQGDHLLKLIEDQFESEITVRGNEIVISGDPEESQAVSALFGELLELMSRGEVLTPDTIDRAIGMLKNDECSPSAVFSARCTVGPVI